jgi:hypothetical protein
MATPGFATPVNPNVPGPRWRCRSSLASSSKNTRGPVEVVVIDRLDKPAFD